MGEGWGAEPQLVGWTSSGILTAALWRAGVMGMAACHLISPVHTSTAVAKPPGATAGLPGAGLQGAGKGRATADDRCNHGYCLCAAEHALLARASLLLTA